jgi:hypothetical protein
VESVNRSKVYVGNVRGLGGITNRENVQIWGETDLFRINVWKITLILGVGIYINTPQSPIIGKEKPYVFFVTG